MPSLDNVKGGDKVLAEVCTRLVTLFNYYFAVYYMFCTLQHHTELTLHRKYFFPLFFFPLVAGMAQKWVVN